MRFVYKSSHPPCPELPFVRVVVCYEQKGGYIDIGKSLARDHVPDFINFNARYHLSAPIPAKIETVELKPSQSGHLELVMYKGSNRISSTIPCFSRLAKKQGVFAYIDANYTSERQMQLHVDDLSDQSVNISRIPHMMRSRFG